MGTQVSKWDKCAKATEMLDRGGMWGCGAMWQEKIVEGGEKEGEDLRVPRLFEFLDLGFHF